MRAIGSVLLLIACGSSNQVGGDSPEAPLRELMSASMTGDASAIRHALVSPDRLRKALDCPADSQLFQELTGALENVDEAARRLGDMKPKVEIRTMKQTGQTKISRGDNFRGCKAVEPFELRSYSFELHMKARGTEDSTTDSGEVIRLDGRWFALLKE